jgi:glycosyltransferase involved in cell wall biosynthesis
MKIALGATSLLSPLTGIGQYVLRLADGLKRRPDTDPWFFYGHRFSKSNPALDDPDVPKLSETGTKLRKLVRTYVPNSYGFYQLRKQFAFNRETRRQKFDVYHEPNYLALRFDGPTVITAHDLSWIRYPETHPVERVRAMNNYFEPALRRATLLLTDSQFVGRELVEVFGVSPDIVRPVHLGVERLFHPMTAEETTPVLQPLGLTHGRYLLSVGTLEPRKNMQATIAAYARLPEAVRSAHPLVVAGMKGWRTSALEQLLDPLVQSGQVRMLGYLSREDLATVTAGASTMVYPSIYEGFGLPPLEAMACGVPPITSDRSSLPEVVGEAGLMVDAEDIDGLTKAMERMLGDTALRATLSDASLRRAATFTWERCVDETVQVYRDAIARA